MRIGRPLAAAALAGVVARGAARVARASGADAAERARTLPGDDLVRGARVVIDRATTLPAPPERVWPWLVQLGKHRGGWYLPTWLERAVPRERRGLRVLDPALIRLAPGDVIPDWGPGDPVFRVAIVEPPHVLVHTSVRERRDREPLELSWALVLGPLDGGRCRLHLRLRINSLGRRAPGAVAVLAGLVDEATVRPMFAGLAERVSAAPPAP